MGLLHDPRVAAKNKQRDRFEAEVKAQQGQLGRKLTGRERSILWSKFAPHFYIVKPPEPQRPKAAELGDHTPDCSLEVV
jgi:hypothetical protein